MRAQQVPAADPNAPLTWGVEAQAESVAPGPDGQLTSGVRVYFKLSNGMAASVFVPHSQYNALAVRKAIEEKVQQITDIGGLSGSVTRPSRS